MRDDRGYFVGLPGNRVFHYDGKSPEEVKLKDVARALSRIDRYGSHGRHVWTVATHSLHVSWVLNEIGFRNLVLEGMLHDAEEAYVGDVIAPMKRALYPAYHNFLAPIRDCVRRAFGIEGELSEHVREADEYVSWLETRHLFLDSTWSEAWGQPFPLMARLTTLNHEIPGEIKAFSKLSAEEQAQRFTAGVVFELHRELGRALSTLEEEED